MGAGSGRKIAKPGQFQKGIGEGVGAGGETILKIEQTRGTLCLRWPPGFETRQAGVHVLHDFFRPRLFAQTLPYQPKLVAQLIEIRGDSEFQNPHAKLLEKGRREGRGI